MNAIDFRRRAFAAAVAVTGMLAASQAPAWAATDLLVAPTRLVFENRTRTAEVVLDNVGAKPATYRISLVLRRMTPDGRLIDVETPSAAEQQALAMVSFAPRRVVLAPNQPQSIRVAVRRPADLPEGEYRVHMLFRGIPDSPPPTAEQSSPAEGFAVQLIPIYGVTIPVIIRNGDLEAAATIVAPRLERADGKEMLAFDLARTGTGSTYGEVRVLKPGLDEPVIRAKGIAVYPEVARRTVLLPPAEDFTGSLKGPLTIQYFETDGDHQSLASEVEVNLN
jgi:hypothetical protein